jgi:Family of unknown function (DUF5677)
VNKPSSSILDRETPTQSVQQHLGAQCDMLRELADYGADLICRAYDASSKELADAIVLGVLLKQIVAMVDAAEALIRIAAVHAAHLQARAACEASLYLEWMLQSDSENKAKHYYVASLRDQRQWAIRATSGSPENMRFVDSLADAGIDDSWMSTMAPEQTANYVKRVNEILAQPALAAIANSFETCAKKTRRGNVEWYKPLGTRSIAEIASKLHRKHEYVIFYPKGSNVVHSGSHFDHIEFLKSGLRLKGVRNLNGCKELVMEITHIAMRSYRVIVEHYLPIHMHELGRLWWDRWRAPFFSMPDFVYV